MRLVSAAIALTGLFAASVQGATSFAGANLYYAAGLSSSQRATYFAALQKAGMKVLRVWLDGQSTSTTKATTITSYPDLETVAPGTFNDQVLNLLDAVMVDAHAYGIKLIISMHSWNALSRPDIYGQWYGTGDFYEQAQPASEFDTRLIHILNHVHTTLGQPWKSLSEYIFAFEAENEAMIGNGQAYIEAHSSWQCDRAQTIKNQLDGAKILVVTGGESWMDESVNSVLLACPYLDVISIHAYGTGDLVTSAITPYVTEAVNAGKKLLFEEWGACYFSSANNVCSSASALTTTQRNNNIQAWASAISAAGVPWLYWQALPNADPHYGYDYEIGITDPSWATLAAVANEASSYASAFDYSAYLP
ncbi:hypothetical protein FRB96_001724 [Tulasnella sp. 330]|nr:hypothetical protein FRB96_001724 [Tulasnella sp. 330]KAG8882354.1 hypothetical protein FRB97_008368 [Tulasnella sp. 331]KAG8886821.1 hypothetical protein FRB98_000957 [Tulasnella sp. 332]